MKTLKSEEEFAGAEYDPGKEVFLILTMYKYLTAKAMGSSFTVGEGFLR